MAVTAPLMFAFTWQDRLASFGDDSVSYLVVANWFAGASGNPLAAQWAAYHSHFPPLLPILLWVSGGVTDYRIAYGLVAAFAVLALPMIYRYASLQLGSSVAGLAVALSFVLLPTAWISLKGILSESLYLMVSMACLLYFEVRLAAREGGTADRWAFGVLLACACLSRALGVAMLMAYAAYCATRVVTRRESASVSMLLPYVPVAAALALWYGLRPHADVDTYRRTVGGMIGMWLADPPHMLQESVGVLSSGWIASFTAQADVSALSGIVLLLLGVLAIAGVVLRVVRNRLDGWFVLFSLAIIFPWAFSAENTRRLLYPLIPALFIGAGDFIRWACDRGGLTARTRAALAATVMAVGAVVTFPALILVAQKAVDREVVIAGYPYTYRELAEYYTTINLETARERAKLAVVTLAGLESIDTATPVGARVMWMRPEYVGLLGHRSAAAFLYRWNAVELAREVKRAKVDYVAQTWLFKTDIEGAEGNPHRDLSAYARPAFAIGDIFVLMQVDSAALDAYLRERRVP